MRCIGKVDEKIFQDKIQSCRHITELLKLWSILELNYNENIERIKITHIFVDSRTGLQ